MLTIYYVSAKILLLKHIETKEKTFLILTAKKGTLTAKKDKSSDREEDNERRQRKRAKRKQKNKSRLSNESRDPFLLCGKRGIRTPETL